MGTAVAQDDLSNACTHSPLRDLMHITIAQPHSERTMCEFRKKCGGERGDGGTENTLMNSFNEEISSIADMTVAEPYGITWND